MKKKLIQYDKWDKESIIYDHLLAYPEKKRRRRVHIN